MEALFETTAIIGASQILVMVLQVIRIKVIAVLIGPEGVGVLGNTVAFVGFWENMSLFGLQIALLRFSSEKIKENRMDVVRMLFSTTLTVHLVVSLISIAFALIFLEKINIGLYQSQAYSFALLLVLLGLPLALFQRDIGNLFNAFNMVKVIGGIKVLSALVGLAVLIPLIVWFSLKGAIISVFARSVAMFLISYYLYYRYLKPKLGSPQWAISKPHAIRMLKYGGFNQIGILINSFSGTFLRVLVTAQLFLSGAGIFNAAMRLGSYALLLQSAVGIYYYPKISTIYNDRRTMVTEMNDVFRFYIILLTPVFVGMLALVEPLIRLLLTDEFVPVSAILGWLLTARLFEMVQGVITLPLFIMEKYKIYLSVIAAFNATMLVSTYLLLTYFDLSGAAAAQGFTYALFFILSCIVAHKVFGFRMRTINWILLGSAVCLIALSCYIGGLGWTFRVIMIVIVMIWLLIVIKKREWIGLVSYLRTGLAKANKILQHG